MHPVKLTSRPAAAQIRKWAERVPAITNKLVQELISFIYPPTCAGCGLALSANLEDTFCLDCDKSLDLIRSPYCPSCGIPNSTEAPRPHLCGECLTGSFHFDRARARGLYRGLLRQVIHRFKYGGQTFLVRPLAQMLTVPGRELISQHKVEFIVPVPLHYIRLRQRGFNQAALLAKRLGATLKISVDYSCLKRSRWTAPQTGLSRRQRAVNVKGAFELIKPEKVRGKSVLL
jgi:predicted amidophosphoribosyltransferase